MPAQPPDRVDYDSSARAYRRRALDAALARKAAAEAELLALNRDKVALGLGRIVALHHRSSTPYLIC